MLNRRHVLLLGVGTASFPYSFFLCSSLLHAWADPVLRASSLLP